MQRSPVWHPFTQMKDAGPFPEVVSARGSVLKLRDGATLLDAISSWWVITHGHCEPAIVEAVKAQASVLDQVIFAGFTHEKAERLAAELVEVTPDRLRHVFFSDDGSTAVEVALKMAVQAQYQNGSPERNLFLAFDSAYHGDTVGAMSVGGDSVFNRSFQPMRFQVIRAAHPKHLRRGVDAFLADFHEKLQRFGSRLAAVIVEPLIQGAGGMIVWPDQAVREIADACAAHGVYLIFDEVMTGFGRTGSLFAMDRLAVQPDLVCLSKGLTGGMLPLSVTLCSDPIYEAFLSDDRAKTFFHGHSFTANPISCAAALASLRLFRERDTRAAWQKIEAIHHERIAGFPEREIIEDARVCGVMAAIEIRDHRNDYLSPLGPDLYKHALANGVLLRPLGNVLYLLPPYCMTDSQTTSLLGRDRVLSRACRTPMRPPCFKRGLGRHAAGLVTLRLSASNIDPPVIATRFARLGTRG